MEPPPPVSYYCANTIMLFAVAGWLSLSMWKLSHSSFFIPETILGNLPCVSHKLGLPQSLMAQYLFLMLNDFSVNGTYFNGLITKQHHRQTETGANVQREVSPS